MILQNGLEHFNSSKKKIHTKLFWSFQPLYYISRLLSINPYRNNNNTFSNLILNDKIYGYSLMAFVISLMIFSIVLRVMYTYSTMALSMIILDLSSSFSQTILVLMSIKLTLNQHGAKIKSLFKKLCKIDKTVFVIPQNYEKTRRKLFLQCGAVTIVTLMFAIGETVLWSESKVPFLGVIGTYSVKYYMFYYKFVIYLQIRARVNIIKDRVEYVNELLSDGYQEQVDVDDGVLFSDVVIKHKVYSKKLELHSIFEAHNTLCAMIDIINEAHGFQILVIVCSIIVAILNLLNTGIILVLSAMFIDDEDDFKFQYGALGIQGILCLFFIIMSILMAAQCSSTVDAANQTKAIAQKLLLEEPITATESNNERYLYREELILFINTCRCPAFSAGGFFTVDYTLLLAIMGAVTSYFIVLLQFANVNGNKIV